MKAHITSAGFLELERNGKIKPQICPMNGNRHMCGDYCPLFGEPRMKEPVMLRDIDRDTGKITTKTVESVYGIITICHGTKLYVELTDDSLKRKDDTE